MSEPRTIQMKTTDHHIPAVLLVLLYDVVLTFVLLDETFVCDHSSESYRSEDSSGTVGFTTRGYKF